jgi:lysophospholipase L1-like esterase
MFLLIQKSGDLIDNSNPYQKIVLESDKRILVVGDSTGVGTGVKNNLESTAGRLSQKYPDYSLENYSINGLRLEGLIEVLSPLGDNKYDLILVQIGANDIFRFTKKENIENRITKVLSMTSKMSNRVIFLHSGNVKDTGMFPSFTLPLISWRSKIMREIYLQKDIEFESAHYVDLFKSEAINNMTNDFDKYYAEDMLHLNGDGYGVWFNEIEKVIELIEN